jgi:hypothetical protein
MRSYCARHATWVIVVGALLLAPVLGACGSSSSGFESVSPEDMVDSGSWYAREAWPHDGNPFESEHFVVYSDAAGPETREETAEIAEELWSELLVRFEVDESDLVFPEDRDHIDIYVYKNRHPDRWGMRAYYAGLIAWSLDHDSRPTDTEDYAPVVEHELVHVLETLLKGRDSTIEPMVDTWFSEGLAEAVAGGTSGGPVRGRDQLADLLAAHDGQNPIALKRDSWYEADDEFHYPMFQLAVEYLLDPEGGNRSPVDARDVFLDMADGATFEEAFAVHMGLPLDTYESEFFALIDGYLPAYRNPLFSPLGIGLLAAAILGAASLVLVTSGRRNRRNASAAARTGFYASTVLGGIVAAVATFGLLVILGTAANLYNESETAGRHLVSWLIVAWFGAALAALAWVQRRWGRGSRLAYLGLPVVVALLAVIIGVAGLML